MWWLWPHLRRLWAAAGTVSAGLAVNYLYGWLGNQPAPALSQFTDYLWRYRYWSLSALLAFAIASVFAERQFRKYKTWPDGTVPANIRFHHSLNREALYDRVPPGHRVELQQRIAVRTEQAYGKRSAEIAAELANHYRQAIDRATPCGCLN